jgi:ATP-dependent protease HslVU (ClpYQ) ATPase subunit
MQLTSKRNVEELDIYIIVRIAHGWVAVACAKRYRGVVFPRNRGSLHREHHHDWPTGVGKTKSPAALPSS